MTNMIKTKIIKNNKKFISDMMLNVIASMIPVIFLQIYILPKTSILLGDEVYGILVTYLSIFNLIPVTFGNVLNNIRLLNNNDKSKLGDYNVILLFFEIISTIILLALTLFYIKELNFFNIILTLILGLLWLYREYHIVIFRIELNFINVLKDNIILTIGYLIGYFFAVLTLKWQLIYILGYICSLVFIFKNSTIFKEPLKRTKLFKKNMFDSSLLFFSNIISRSVTYADKLIIYPILGATAVSVYYAASIFSKIVNLALSPIASVILSYVTKMKKNKNNVFTLTLKISSVILILGSICCYFIAKPLLLFIYPQYAFEAIKYIPLLLISMIFSTLSHILNPFILKFFKLKWQIFINSITLIFYILISIVLLNTEGLLGFCYGIMFSNLLKLILILVIYYLKKERDDTNEKK